MLQLGVIVRSQPGVKAANVTSPYNYMAAECHRMSQEGVSVSQVSGLPPATVTTELQNNENYKYEIYCSTENLLTHNPLHAK